MAASALMRWSAVRIITIDDAPYATGPCASVGAALRATAPSLCFVENWLAYAPKVRIAPMHMSVAMITDANERTVRNWFEGKNGPSGESLCPVFVATFP